jgi:chemotaxis protein methyltransferase CheR
MPLDTVAGLPHLKPAEFDEIRKFAKRLFGLDLRNGKEELVSARLARGMRQGRFASFRDYLDNVEHDSTGQALIALINALTTNHTSFYREPQHFEFLTSSILPEFQPGASLRIWSAASSTGEEPYSIACAVAQHWGVAGRQSCGTRDTPVRSRTPAGVAGLRILATDISTRVIEAAKNAVYPVSALAPAPAYWLQNCFQRSDQAGMVRVRPELASAVTFRRLNLIEPIPFQDRFHVIFCRNVMIYFDKATQERVVQALTGHLEPGGHLFVGHSESLAGVTHSLTYVQPAVYRNDAGKPRGAR